MEVTLSTSTGVPIGGRGVTSTTTHARLPPSVTYKCSTPVKVRLDGLPGARVPTGKLGLEPKTLILEIIILPFNYFP